MPHLLLPGGDPELLTGEGGPGEHLTVETGGRKMWAIPVPVDHHHSPSPPQMEHTHIEANSEPPIFG